MGIWQKRAVINAIIGVMATVGFLVAGFTGGGPGGLVEDTARRNIAAAFVAFGIFSNILVTYLTRHRPDKPSTLVDERDRAIHRISTEVSLRLTVAAVFLGCLILYETNAEAGSISANWVWFMGYGVFLVSNLGWAVPAVLMYAGVGGRAEG